MILSLSACLHVYSCRRDSDSDHNLDEIVVAQLSPIHYCDNGEASTSTGQRHQLPIDDKGTVIKISSFDESTSSHHILQKQSSNPQCSQQSLDPSSAYKNSKTRRTEYSMRGIKIGCSNPSQDSAFGSMTDGELSHASSFKLSSFQSVSSPIDEGVEDINEDKNRDNSISTIASSLKFIDSNSSCSSPCPDKFTQSLNDLDIAGPSNINPLHVTNIRETCIFLDPPKLIVNDDSTGNYIYTSSPIRKCATTEVFSQKYRVSSFEDMALNSNHLKHQVNKKAFRSFEEEQRIESAFTPIKSSGEKVLELPIKHFTSTMTGRERSILWKDSFLKCNKNNLTIKSKESICELETDDAKEACGSQQATIVKADSNEDNNDDDNDDDDETSIEYSSASITAEMSSTQSSRRARSDRLSFSLARFKQNAIIESVALDTLSESSNSKVKKHSNSSSSNDESNVDNTTITSTTNDECNSEEECSSLTESLLKTPSIDDVRKFVKSFESEEGSGSVGNSEEAPLLGIEMLSISSSTEPE
ncbi:CLUMA_CG007367, isoform A [Clunio marinus]|uniref:CLUMA_CG007367, isoform A n=1 Tax=Clunio marinus TaxID=568069 RepID=A0A1J1I0H8_9DIPT|nr:CLUMA_CG007367, isoform A [Clunio marinus]